MNRSLQGYTELDKKQQRLVNKVIMAMHSGQISDADFLNINKLLNRARRSETNRNPKKYTNGYLIFYKERFKKHKKKQKDVGGVTGIAKIIGREWRALQQHEREKYKKLAADMR